MKYFPILKGILWPQVKESKDKEKKIAHSKIVQQNNKEIPEICKLIIEVSLNTLSSEIFNLLKISGFNIKLKKKIEKLENHEKLLASANLLDFNMNLYLDLDSPDILKDSYLQQIPHSIFHEVGHLVFYHQLKACEKNATLKQNILNFCEISISSGAVSPLSHGYINETYGKKLRENNLHIIKGVDIKFHENFAETFRIDHIHKLEYLLNKDTPSELKKELKEAYESVCLFN